MNTCGISQDNQWNLLQIVAGILHLGNVTFVEGKQGAEIADPQCKNIY
jgi:myosin-1